jgi:hypothetical protein
LRYVLLVGCSCCQDDFVHLAITQSVALTFFVKINAQLCPWKSSGPSKQSPYVIALKMVELLFSGLDLLAGGHLGTQEEGDRSSGHFRFRIAPVPSAERSEVMIGKANVVKSH